MVNVSCHKQNTSEWLEWRKDMIGASDAPVIMGVSPFKTPRELWLYKRGEAPEQIDTPWMRRGRELESTALKAFEKETDILMFPRVLIHKSIKWMIASLDGINVDWDRGVEIKTPGKVDHDLAKRGVVPEKYIPQLQHQIEVAGLKFIYYCSFDGTNVAIIEVDRDDDYIKKMLKKEKQFYKMFMDGIAPDLTDRDHFKREDKDWAKAEESWKLSYETLQEAKKFEECFRKDLINLSNGQSSIGSSVKVTKFPQKGRVNYDIVPELWGVDLDKYRWEGREVWRLSSITQQNKEA